MILAEMKQPELVAILGHSTAKLKRSLAEYRVQTFNAIIAKYHYESRLLPAPHKKTFLHTVLVRDFPKVYSELTSQGFNKQHGLQFLTKCWFPNSNCPGCGKNLGGLKLYCGKRCHRLFTTGYTHHLQDPTKREALKNSLVEKYGVGNVSQLQFVKDKKRLTANKNFGGEGFASDVLLNKVRASLKSKTGYDHPMLNPEVRAKIKATLLERTGYDNPSKNPQIKKQKEQTCFRNHGVINPSRSRTVKLKKEISYFTRTGYVYPSQNPEAVRLGHARYKSKTGYDHPMLNPEVRAKIKATLLERTGYDNPLADPATFEKAMRSQYRIKTFIYNGSIFRCQGYEHIVTALLIDRHGDRNVHTQFSSEYRTPEKCVGIPDIYVSSIDTWVEVKSTYTLLGTKLQDTLKNNKAKAAKQPKVRWIVVTNPKHFEYVVLPEAWYTFTRKSLEKLFKNPVTKAPKKLLVEVGHNKLGPEKYAKDAERTQKYGPAPTEQELKQYEKYEEYTGKLVHDVYLLYEGRLFFGAAEQKQFRGKSLGNGVIINLKYPSAKALGNSLYTKK